MRSDPLFLFFPSVFNAIAQAFPTEHRLLVTGTPLQNNIKELWALLSFLQPEKYADFDEFSERVGKLETQDQVEKLHTELKPLLLRRLKKDVEKSLPSKNEHILRVEMTPMQKQYYKWILSKNFAALNKNNTGSAVRFVSFRFVLLCVCVF